MNSKRQKHFFQFLYIGIFVFLVLSIVCAIVPYFKIDLLISEKIQSINSSFFDKLMWHLTSVGNEPTMAVIVFFTCLILYIFKLRIEAIVCTVSTAGSVIVGQIIKMLVNRPRPTPNLIRVLSTLTDKSYPSGHTLVFTTFFGFLLYLLFKKVKKYKVRLIIPAIVLMFLIATIGISRIYLGAHWASDVLGGYTLGVLWLVCTIRIYNSYNGKR